ncbi:hypothetical protein FHG87_004388 [Trinorchestia longiramus]|nr:hypothetical protein FHG87_004388 [Trinorchestia longiramus]
MIWMSLDSEPIYRRSVRLVHILGPDVDLKRRDGVETVLNTGVGRLVCGRDGILVPTSTLSEHRPWLHKSNLRLPAQHWPVQLPQLLVSELVHEAVLLLYHSPTTSACQPANRGFFRWSGDSTSCRSLQSL